MTKQVSLDDLAESQPVEGEPLLKGMPRITAGSKPEQQAIKKEGESSSNMFAIVYFTLVSGFLLVINKVAIVALPAPTFLLFCQLAFTAGAVRLAAAAGIVTVEAASRDELLRFLPVAFSLLGTVYSNFKVLQHANVETFITFRSSTPVVLSFCDWAFLGRALPSPRSWVSLALLVASTAGYAWFDTGFQVDAYLWLGVWYAFYTFDAVWNKHLCNSTPTLGNWARVYYSNALSTPVMALLLAASRKERALVAAAEWGPGVLSPLLASCAVGVCMSHASYLLRSAMSAATAALVGIACKLLSVVLNMIWWDKHAGPVELGFLAMGIVAAAMYEQAPMRRPARPAAAVT